MVQGSFSMPHPVLGIEGDFKEGGFSVAMRIKIDRATRQYRFNDIAIAISNSYIEQLFSNKLAHFVIKISCTPTYKTWTLVNPSEFVLSEFDLDALIEVEAFLVAATTIESYYDDTFSDDFEGVDFKLEKGDIVALTGIKKIPIRKEDEKVSLGSIFKFSKISEESEIQELHFDFEDNKINIRYPTPKSDFDPVTLLFDKTHGMPFTALNLYILPALREAFDIMSDSAKDYSDKKWYHVLDSLLPANERVDDPVINAQRCLKFGLPINFAFEEIIKLKQI